MKTKNRALDAANYSFQANEAILVDANIWLFLFPPASKPTPAWAVSYSSVFARMLKAGAKPMIDALILSEYLNRYLRLEQKATAPYTLAHFKDFRRSMEGAKALHSAVSDISEILKNAKTADTLLSVMDLSAVISAVQSGGIDFNDGLLIQTCRQQRWKLLTDDGDMAIGGIEVLTTNGKLLRACA